MLLSEPHWLARRAAHEQRVEPWLEPHLARRRRREAHPVEDFLFTYYSFRPAQLRRWHPGFGVVLAGESARPYLRTRGYGEVADGVTARAERPESVRWIRDLLAATAGRPAFTGCLGLHEWAMVYRSDEVRHGSWPLRLGAAGTDRVVESNRIRCTHHDAFRFFTADAVPRNALQPSRDSQLGLEQPGCLHANMDLFKWSYKLTPLIPSELVADCFAFAQEIRAVDMRASPYDLSALGYEPIAIETAAGKASYIELQRGFSERAQVLRAELIRHCDDALSGRALSDEELSTVDYMR
ncbi:MAG TPA: 3-methyladenine DNA glycosylase [Mycobacteriales bacterium]|nr:3-methyladenine DNA glycosylase [Mycobacteriales bacterium]